MSPVKWKFEMCKHVLSIGGDDLVNGILTIKYRL